MAIDKQFIEMLEDKLRLWRVQDGIDLLNQSWNEIERLTPRDNEAPRLLLIVAQWVDAGFRDYRSIQPLLEHYNADQRQLLSIRDYLCVRLVTAFIEFARGQLDSAIDILENVLSTFLDVHDKEKEALAHFWKGRAHRKKGEYEIALKHIVSARELSINNGAFAAIVQIQESWLLFQKGMTKEAEKTLNCAECVLISTDHYVALANIESARGRFVRRTGAYNKALEKFACAAEIYEKRDPNHVNLARTLVNAAYVRRLLALQLRRKIDSHAHSHRQNAKNSRTATQSRELPLVEYQRFWQAALDALKRAREIYSLHAHFDGIGKVQLSLGYLHLDRGDIERANDEAAEAYRIGAEQRDQILKARARILQSAIENAHVEEQTGEEVDVAVHANLAREFSQEAMTLAQSTQNRRLLAAAFIARGNTAANEFFQDWETARSCATEATGLLSPGESDHLVEDLGNLKTKILRGSEINDLLRNWSEGMVGNKTFQQIVEEFAEVVIPKVWMREGRKISRVAESLSISPKKVRRILRNTGSI
jgi:tetratricopeptide (TPR) repeat protein